MILRSMTDEPCKYLLSIYESKKTPQPKQLWLQLNGSHSQKCKSNLLCMSDGDCCTELLPIQTKTCVHPLSHEFFSVCCKCTAPEKAKRGSGEQQCRYCWCRTQNRVCCRSSQLFIKLERYD
ncbi:unnamed protein product [Moneuplotes crassus]|uniref:Uncharacterized protein n=1 Tax=Euplotes crassus TaxID=5936 RepID=A0AAD1UIJ9_EUPCR|nr:unnamed protein product [Moneuplotes crassus]